MKKIICLTLLSVTLIRASAQNLNVRWGAELKHPSGSYINSIIGEDNDGFYVMRTKGKLLRKSRLWLERYSNKTMKQIFSKELLMPNTKGKEVDFEDLKYVDGKLLLFTSYFNKKLRKNYAFVQHINEKGIVSRNFKEMDQITVTKTSNRGSFDFILSEDSTKILVYHNAPYEKYSNEKFSYKVIDKDLNVIWSKSIELPYRDKYFSISNYLVDNFGNVYMLAEIYPDRQKGEKKERGKQNAKFVILAYYYKTGELKEFDVTLKDKWISEITFKVDKQGNLVAGGFYSNDKYFSIAGTFYLTIDKKTKIVKAKGIKEFSKAFLMEFMSERKADKGKELKRFYFDHFVLRDDGGAVMVAEQYYVKVTTYTDSKGNTRTTYHYYYNDIIVVSISPDGTITWAKKIPKKQHSTNDGGPYSSYIFAVFGDKMYFIFNDNPKNIQIYKTDPKKIKYMNKPKKSIATLVTVDSNGEMKRIPMFSAKDFDVIIRPKLHLQSSDKDLIIYGQKRSIYKFGKIELN
ncbi:hypothetical protein JYU16_00500 [bacterium AH-315-M05]|nr:hypothetical protein [bacterium AH-315-M05]